MCIGVPAKRGQKRFAHSTASRKEKKGGACLPGVRRAVRSQVPGERGKLGEVGEWQCEVRWGARRVVARRAQGAVGNVSRGECGNFEVPAGNSKKKKEIRLGIPESIRAHQ